MANAILRKEGTNLEKLSLLPSGGGRFEVVLDGSEVFSKAKEGRFPDESEVLGKL